LLGDAAAFSATPGSTPLGLGQRRRQQNFQVETNEKKTENSTIKPLPGVWWLGSTEKQTER